MKKWLRFEVSVVLFALVISFLEGCKEKTSNEPQDLALNSEVASSSNESKTSAKKPLSEDFKNYWYAGDAEITSYKLEQARYGELREGEAVLIFVTEPFLPDVQVKADGSNSNNIPVLKLNATKKYLTGIYPYSIMSSTFYPVHNNQHAIKSSLSVQEWCGQVYMQLNNRDNFEIMSHSYFESEADQQLKLDKALLENEIWNKIRINPEGLPTGNIEIIPSLEYFRVQHKPVQAYAATAILSKNGAVTTYAIDYSGTDRKLTINFSADFPYQIESWEEEFKSGFGANAKTMVSKGKKMKTLKTPYWKQNSNKYIALRDSLGLKI
ncbi:septum formation inhibitor Maf [Allomuricauda sp. d1]|uniref:septum formation inhibitor Maf n=1 Tax=Allomuricauda sp. d1 TaxID=3136725 RepID=UPI0031D6A470